MHLKRSHMTWHDMTWGIIKVVQSHGVFKRLWHKRTKILKAMVSLNAFKRVKTRVKVIVMFDLAFGTSIYIFLLNPFWNHWLSLQCGWLSAVWIYSKISLSFALIRIIIIYQPLRLGQQHKTINHILRLCFQLTNRIPGIGKTKNAVVNFAKFGY